MARLVKNTPPSEVLKREIHQRKLSGYAIGKLVGVSEDSIQRWFNGTNTIRLETFDRICLALRLRLVADE